MLDPGRYIAEAIYFLQYTFAQILWALNRALLAIAVIAESINTWLTANAAYFVELVVNALSAPLGGMFILALAVLGSWYLINNIVATERWVDPSKLAYYGTLSLLFFASPLVVVNGLERLRDAINSGVDPALIAAASGDIFDTSADGTDTGLPSAIPDTNSDGIIASFDLVSAFILLANLTELDSSEFPLDFEATYFPYGDPSSINLADEADREQAKSLASEGIQRLLFALFAVPTAIAEHFLRLALTSSAMFIYLGLPFAMLFAFFVATQAYLGAYLRQFLRLLLETFFSVVIIVIVIILLVAAAEKGIGFYIGASLIAFVLLLWRIKSAFRLAAASLDLFGGGMLTGGAGGMQIVNTGRQMMGAGVSFAAAALTGGATMAVGSAALASAAALRADANRDGQYLRTDPAKAEGRIRQFKTIAGYSFGRNQTARRVIEGTHEVRTLARNLRDGETQDHAPDLLDYMRAGSSMSGFGSSPWLAMRLSPSLRAAYDEIGGSPGYSGHPLGLNGDTDGAPVSFAPTDTNILTHPRSPVSVSSNPTLADPFANLEQAISALTIALQNANLSNGQPAAMQHDATIRQRANGNAATSPTTQPVVTRPSSTTQQTNAARPATSAAAPPQHLAGTATTTAQAGQAVASSKVAAPQPSSSQPLSTQPSPDSVAVNNPSNTVEVVASANRNQPQPFESAPSSAPATPSVRSPRGTVQFEPLHPTRRAAIEQTLQQLASSDSNRSEVAQQSLSGFVGEHNAQHIGEAVRGSSAETVTASIDTIFEVVASYQSRNVSDADILQAFQTGEAISAVRATTETPLTDSQLAAVTDTVLLPSRQLSRSELVGVIADHAADDTATDQTIATAIGSPIGFGGQTGNVRGVLNAARALQLSSDELAQLADQISQGMRRTAAIDLIARGAHPAVARELVADIAALPTNLAFPQSTTTPHEGDSHAA